MTILRFQETECYSPVLDDYETTFMAIGSNGTYYAKTVASAGESLRMKRKIFRNYVEQAVAKGIGPCKVQV